jgi:predicted small metal-binding protein
VCDIDEYHSSRVNLFMYVCADLGGDCGDWMERAQDRDR